MAWAEKRNNSWVGFFRDAQGKKHRAGTASTETKAKKLAQDQETDVRRGTFHDPRAGSITFEEYFEKEWSPNRSGELNSMATWESHYKSALKPVFGKTPLNKITTVMVQNWVGRLEREGVLAQSTIQAQYRTLATILGAKKGRSAVRDKLLLTGTPCEGIAFAPSSLPVPKAYEVEQVDALMAAIKAWYRPLVMLATVSGLRWGELLGLRVSDFEPDYRSFTVNRTVVQLTLAQAEAHYPGVNSRFVTKHRPKSGVTRKVSIPAEAAMVIRAMVGERQLKPHHRLFSMPDATGTAPRTSEAWPTGVPISRSYFRNHVWVPAHAVANSIGAEEEGEDWRDIPVLKVHALRASHITWLLAGGADLGLIMTRVGHNDLATTQRYLAAMADADRRALDALAETMRRGRTEKKKKSKRRKASGE